MKTHKESPFIKITDFNVNVIAPIIKYDFPMLLTYEDVNGNAYDFIKIISRADKTDRITYQIKNPKTGKMEKPTATYKELLDLISVLMSGKNLPDNIEKISLSLVIRIHQNWYNLYADILTPEVLDAFDKDIKNNALKIRYDQKAGYYSILFPYDSGKPKKYYYFEENNSLITIDKKGWNLYPYKLGNEVRGFASIKELLTA
jgi:hypothetical protein